MGSAASECPDLSFPVIAAVARWQVPDGQTLWEAQSSRRGQAPHNNQIQHVEIDKASPLGSIRAKSRFSSQKRFVVDKRCVDSLSVLRDVHPGL
jgi:hypothetical protein